MAQIGRVYKDSYTKGGVEYPLIMLDIRTISVRKKFTISVNKNKYEDGKITSLPVQGKEEHPDYHIWHNFSNRGEFIPSVIVGNIKNAVSESGLNYKRAKLFDPFLSKENIYFTLFEVEKDKKIDENHLYNVVAEPYRKMTQSNDYSQQAQPQYEQNAKTYKKQDGTNIPMTTESIPIDYEEETPF